VVTISVDGPNCDPIIDQVSPISGGQSYPSPRMIAVSGTASFADFLGPTAKYGSPVEQITRYVQSRKQSSVPCNVSEEAPKLLAFDFDMEARDIDDLLKSLVKRYPPSQAREIVPPEIQFFAENVNRLLEATRRIADNDFGNDYRFNNGVKTGPLHEAVDSAFETLDDTNINGRLANIAGVYRQPKTQHEMYFQAVLGCLSQHYKVIPTPHEVQSSDETAISGSPTVSDDSDGSDHILRRNSSSSLSLSSFTSASFDHSYSDIDARQSLEHSGSADQLPTGKGPASRTVNGKKVLATTDSSGRTTLALKSSSDSVSRTRPQRSSPNGFQASVRPKSADSRVASVGASQSLVRSWSAGQLPTGKGPASRSVNRRKKTATTGMVPAFLFPSPLAQGARQGAISTPGKTPPKGGRDGSSLHQPTWSTCKKRKSLATPRSTPSSPATPIKTTGFNEKFALPDFDRQLALVASNTRFTPERQTPLISQMEQFTKKGSRKLKLNDVHRESAEKIVAKILDAKTAERRKDAKIEVKNLCADRSASELFCNIVESLTVVWGTPQSTKIATFFENLRAIYDVDVDAPVPDGCNDPDLIQWLRYISFTTPNAGNKKTTTVKIEWASNPKSLLDDYKGIIAARLIACQTVYKDQARTGDSPPTGRTPEAIVQRSLT